MNINEIDMEIDKQMLPEWYDAYKKNKGKHTLEKFETNLAKFFNLTLHCYVYGEILDDGSEEGHTREKAWGQWVKYIGSKKEAMIYFKSVDQVTAYT